MVDEIFGVYPNNIELYKLALIHRSAMVTLENGMPVNNERLEFLGDAVLESIVSDFLFIEYPEEDEGFLSKIRSRIVSRSTLNSICKKLGLDKFIITQQSNKHIIQKHLYGDALEAMVGALYLDKGYNTVNKLFINNILKRYIDLEEITVLESDYKSRLIEWCQKNRHEINFDTSLDAIDNGRQTFKCELYIDSDVKAMAAGNSKKEAEQRASAKVYKEISESSSL
ncbi:MAG: ribonuclease III [Rikenellaceae bacterium]|nr:ribonuclease III [Rikenellaceae bacterium]